MASLGIITGALFLMPTITAFVGSFFVDEVAEAVEREYYPAEPPGRALPFFRALIEGVKIALLALIVYFCALPFIFFAGLGVIILFLANSYLLGREYFELAAMRFRPPLEAKAHAQGQRDLCLSRRHGDRGVRVDPGGQSGDADFRHGLHGAHPQAHDRRARRADRAAALNLEWRSYPKTGSRFGKSCSRCAAFQCFSRLAISAGLEMAIGLLAGIDRHVAAEQCRAAPRRRARRAGCRSR